MHKFATEHPNQENAGEYYNSMTTRTYDQFLVRINFTDPYKIAEVISRPAPAVDGQTFGFLNLPKDAAIFDIGQGSGLLGRLLYAEGYSNI